MDKTESEIIHSIKENMYFQTTYFSSYSPKINITSKDVIIKQTDIDDDTFNVVLNVNFTNKNADLRIEEIKELYKKKNLPFSWWVGPGDTPSNLKKLLLSHGFIPKENNYGMYLDLDNFTPKKPYNLKIRRVCNLSELKEFDNAHVLSGGNEKAFDIIFKYLPRNVFDKESPFQFYSGYINNKLVTTGILVLHADVGGIYYIVTLPEERRKGYASEMMNYIIAEAKKFNYKICVLQASEEGKKVYEKMGFKHRCLFEEFILENN
jgi:GNAT superfamily N-acetyltransferase